MKSAFLIYPKPQTGSAESVSDKLLYLSSILLCCILPSVKVYYAA